MMDSEAKTREHIYEVNKNIDRVVQKLLDRAINHDSSKLEPEEKELFDEYTPRLAGMTYGSDEYKKCLEKLKPALDHHYSTSRHHPEFHKNGISDMNLIDLIEMLCDWWAATKRHADGNIRKSIEINQERFGYSDELKGVLLNTINYLEPRRILKIDIGDMTTEEAAKYLKKVRKELGPNESVLTVNKVRNSG
jgi:hypothetical protein